MWIGIGNYLQRSLLTFLATAAHSCPRVGDQSRRLSEFCQDHPDAETPLRQWYKVALHASWNSLVDVRAQFPHADPVTVESRAVVTVFNIGGNKYRLIARIEY